MARPEPATELTDAEKQDRAGNGVKVDLLGDDTMSLLSMIRG